MLDAALRLNRSLVAAGRLPALARPGARISAAEMGALVLVGIVTGIACSMRGRGPGIPGHAIVRAVLPMAFGLAIVPRRLAGSIMSASALATAAAIGADVRFRTGAGATASMTLLGPLLDFALLGSYAGWRLHLRFVGAAVAANAAAFTIRAGAKALGLDAPGARALDAWWLRAVVTYALSGAVAGLLSALVWFRLRALDPPPGERERA